MIAHNQVSADSLYYRRPAFSEQYQGLTTRFRLDGSPDERHFGERADAARQSDDGVAVQDVIDAFAIIH